MAEAGVSFAFGIGIELVRYIIGEVRRHQTQVELARSYLTTYILSINESQITSDMNVAKLIVIDPAVSVRMKEDVVHAYDEVHRRLEQLKADLKIYVETNNVAFITKKRALRRLDNGSKKLKEEMGAFQTLVLSLNHNSPSKELQLSEHDFTFITGSHREWITEMVFHDTAWLSREIRGISTGSHAFVVEKKEYRAGKKESVKLDIVLLNQRLAAADRTPGIPNVLGFRDEPNDHGYGEFQLVMTIPNFSPRANTLEEYIRLYPNTPSLNDRVRLCANLAEAVLHVHTLGLVHKNIRPENILLVPEEAPGALSIHGKLYLIGWQYARKTEGFKTSKAGEVRWERFIYQHPLRHGLTADSEYRMEHDIYSLGVCMLVILLWSPLNIDDDKDGKISELFRDTFFSLGLDKKALPQDSYKTETDWITGDGKNVKNILLAMADTHLPQAAGTKMAAKVTECLNDSVSRQVQEAGSQGHEHQDNPEVGAHFAIDILIAIRNVASSI